MKVALLVDEDETIEGKLNMLSYTPEIISPYYQLLTADVVENYQSLGFQVIPWTINKEGDMKQMIKWQVDAIITDYPDRLIKLLKR